MREKPALQQGSDRKPASPRAVVAIEDPDPRVSGRGIARLREAGIEVTIGVCRDEAAALNLGFFLRVTEGRPMVTLKLATSLDGRIATASGDSKWITGEQARAEAHCCAPATTPSWSVRQRRSPTIRR